MKKIVSILIAFTVLLSTVSLFTITSFAEETTKYWEPRPNAQDALGCVNDEPADSIYIVADKDYNASRIEYLGEGRLTGWEFPTLTEGKDYQIITQYDNIIIVKFTNGIPYINALVDFSDENQDAATQSAQSIAPVESETTEEQKNKADNMNTLDYPKPENQESPTTAGKNMENPEAISIHTAEHNMINGTKTIILCFCAGAAVCLLVIPAVKRKNEKKKNESYTFIIQHKEQRTCLK